MGRRLVGIGIITIALGTSACSAGADAPPGSSGGSGGSSSGQGGSGQGGSGQGGSAGSTTGTGGGFGQGGTFGGTGNGGSFNVGDANIETCGTNLTGIVRDFKIDFPDMELAWKDSSKRSNYHDIGLVDAQLGSDGKPVYIGGPNGSPTTTGPANFAKWYNDDATVNQRKEFTLEFAESETGSMVIDSRYNEPWRTLGGFFPIDNELWGNDVHPGNNARLPHNYHFTFELNTKFLYKGGETFTFSGDDDVWVFINGILVVDLGGVHGRLEQTIYVDQLAGALGISPGNEYALDLFHAERQVTQSNLRIETNFTFTKCGPVK
jgi:fibro-slime domain-containing protein